MRMLSVVVKPYERVGHKVSELHYLHHKLAVIMSCHDYPLTSSTPLTVLVICLSCVTVTISNHLQTGKIEDAGARGWMGGCEREIENSPTERERMVSM